MSLTGGIVIYVIMWWVVLFAVLPFGVRNPDEAGEDLVPGQADGAPVRPMMWRKMLATTLITSALFGIILANDHFGWFSLLDVFDPVD